MKPVSFRKSLCSLVLATFGFAGCATKTEQWEVSDKYYKTERNWVQMVTMPREYKVSNEKIIINYVIPMHHHVDGIYLIRATRNNPHGQNEYITFQVDKNTYDRLIIHRKLEFQPRFNSIEDNFSRRPATPEEMEQMGVLGVEPELQIYEYNKPDP